MTPAGVAFLAPPLSLCTDNAGMIAALGYHLQDLALSVHPHPTLSETVAFAAEAFEGTITDLYMPKKK